MTETTIEQTMQSALGHHQAGRLTEAEALYHQVLARASDHVEALHSLGVLASQVGRTEVALELIGRAIAINPAVALYHSNLGEIYRRSGQPDRAIGHFRRAIELRPDAADPHNNLGNVLWEKGRLDEALATYRRAIELKPDHAEAHSNLGVVFKAQGRLDDALAAFHRAIALRPSYAEGHSNLGDALKELGRFDEALAAYRQAIALKPDLAQTHNSLGCALKDQGRIEEAIAAFHQAIQISPGYAAAQSNLGCALKDEGRLDEAIAAFHRAIALKPDLADAHNNLGNALKAQGRLEEAIAAYRRAIEFRPGYATAHRNLGCVLKDQGQRDEAITAYTRTIALEPDDARDHNNLAIVLLGQGRLEEAIAACQRAIALKPDYAKAYNNLGVTLAEQGQHDAAIAAYQRALELNPSEPAEIYINLGNALRDQGRRDEAIAVSNRAIALKPDDARAHNNLAIALWGQGRIDEAVAACKRAIALQPDLTEAHNTLGNVLKDQGRLDEALVCFRKAVALKPDYSKAASNLVCSVNYHPDHDTAAIRAELRRWDAQFAAPLAPLIQPHTNEPAPDRRLRIGYVSPDFREHVVGLNLLTLFREHDHQGFEIFCYSDAIRPDALTRRFQDHADVWRDVRGRSHDQVAQLVRDDRIDILVDLALHTAGNRLLVFARQPAPVQVSFAGYPGSTGLSAIGYRLTDPYLELPGLDESDGAEEPFRLPDSFWCFDPLSDEPAVNPLPAEGHGHVTFGCLNNFVKVNAQVLALWARVLRAVARSCLIVLAHEGKFRRDTVERLEQEGIAPDRVGFVSYRPRRQYLEQYHDIDLMLDTFPYNGHTTSLDALWMGVPVVTLVGRTVVGRAGLSQLTNLGLPELAATTPEEFVRIAVELAGDLSRLASLRASLRDRMGASPLMDAARFARGIEAAYRTMWQRWCARSGSSTPRVGAAGPQYSGG